MSTSLKYTKLYYIYLKELGISQEVPISAFPESQFETFEAKRGNLSATFEKFITVYESKDQYLYISMYDNVMNNEDPEYVKEHMKKVMETIRYDNKSRMIEIGWKWKSPYHQTELPKTDKTRLLFEAFKHFRGLAVKGEWCGVEVIDGDTVVVYPRACKDWLTYTTSSMEIGTKQRHSMAKRFGFGEVSFEGTQFATYNKGKLIPWRD
tara:strand:- start:264 stop:887 length:624 start_codon:yes stop_codon:yes gene_type:complete